MSGSYGIAKIKFHKDGRTMVIFQSGNIWFPRDSSLKQILEFKAMESTHNKIVKKMKEMGDEW